MKDNELYIVGVGASAGGHQALREFFQDIPPGLPAAFIVVTHLLREHRSVLDEIVGRYSVMPVERIHHVITPLPGHVYVMPENVLLEIEKGVLQLTPRPEGLGWNQAINVFFASLAKDQGTKAIGIILSGMGSDGAEGSLKLYHAGGKVLVQDPNTTEFDSMPRAVIEKDHPNHILPPREIGRKLASMLLDVR